MSAAALSLAGLATPAHADSSGCGGDTCIHMYTPSGGSVRIDAWAYGTTFYGHFDLTRGGKVIGRIGDRWMQGGGPAVTFWESAIVGTYCTVGWSSAGEFEGRACENLE